MIVHDSWWSNGSERFNYHRLSSAIIDYHEPFDKGFTLELRFRKKLQETAFYVNQQRFWWIFCFEAMGKGEFLRDENRTFNFTL